MNSGWGRTVPVFVWGWGGPGFVFWPGLFHLVCFGVKKRGPRFLRESPESLYGCFVGGVELTSSVLVRQRFLAPGRLSTACGLVGRESR